MTVAFVFGLTGYSHFSRIGQLPSLKEYWWLVAAAPLLGGTMVAIGCRGAVLGKRIITAAISGALAGLLATLLLAVLIRKGEPLGAHFVSLGVWQAFVFTILSTVGAILTELLWPEPKS